MDITPQEFPNMELRAADAVFKINRVFTSLPPVDKRFALFGDFVMTLSGMKAGTDYGFLGDTFDPTEFETFKRCFELEGLRIEEPTITTTKSGDSFRQGHIWNPKTLEQNTRNSKLVLPYKPNETLDDWVKKCKAAGISEGAIYGTFYSFPESAIKDFINGKQDRQTITHHFGNETYWHHEPAQQDVLKREQEKKAFFSALEQNPTFRRLATSQELKQSDQLWSERLPEWTRKRK